MIFTGPTGPDLAAWARRLVDELNRFLPNAAELPTFADDTEAGAARVKIGEEYFTPDGFRRRRVS